MTFFIDGAEVKRPDGGAVTVRNVTDLGCRVR